MDNSLLAVRDINHKYIVVEKGKYLRLGNWFGGASYYFFFGDQPEGIIETAVTNDWNVIETFKEYYEDFSYGKLGKIDFDE